MLHSCQDSDLCISIWANAFALIASERERGDDAPPLATHCTANVNQDSRRRGTLLQLNILSVLSLLGFFPFFQEAELRRQIDEAFPQLSRASTDAVCRLFPYPFDLQAIAVHYSSLC